MQPALLNTRLTQSDSYELCTTCGERVGFGVLYPRKIRWYYLLSSICAFLKCPKCIRSRQTGYSEESLNTVCSECREAFGIPDDCGNTKDTVARVLSALQVQVATAREVNETLLKKLAHMRFVGDEVRWTSKETRRFQLLKHSIEQECAGLQRELRTEQKRTKLTRKHREAIEVKIEHIADRLKQCVVDLE